MERRLAAILAADVVGYSRLMGEDEARTLAALRSHRQELIDPAIADHHGHVVKLMGDGMLVEFPSVVEAVQCAVEIQRAMVERNLGVPADRQLTFRVGINVGDVMVEDGDIYGDGVNVAARLEALAEPGGICISRAVRDQILGKLDFAMEDLGEVEVKNIARPVHAFHVRIDPGAVASGGGRRRLRLAPAIALGAVVIVAVLGALIWRQPWTSQTDSPPAERPADLPAIAVLPFDNMSGDPEQDYFSDGITEDLITDLSQVSGLLVIARNSVFTYKGKAVKVQQVARELGVKFIVEGSVRRIGNRVRINAQLIDASNEYHIWAERYDRELTDIFALQDEVVKRIVGQLAIKLTRGEQDRLNRSVAINPEAYDVLLQGVAQLRRFTGETNAAARLLFERAAEIDPLYARAHADVALTHALDVEFGWTDSPEASLRTAVKHAQVALAQESSDPHVFFALSMSHMAQRQYDEAIAMGRKATRLYPNYADGFAQLAQSLTYAGESQEALMAIGKAMHINPRHGLFYVWIVGHNYFLMARYDEAIVELQKVVEGNPGFPWAHLTLASAYGLTGQIEEAEWEGQEFLALQPNFSLAHEARRVLYKSAEHRDRYIEGLSKAGLPE